MNFKGSREPKHRTEYVQKIGKLVSGRMTRIHKEDKKRQRGGQEIKIIDEEMKENL